MQVHLAADGTSYHEKSRHCCSMCKVRCPRMFATYITGGGRHQTFRPFFNARDNGNCLGCRTPGGQDSNLTRTENKGIRYTQHT